MLAVPVKNKFGGGTTIGWLYLDERYIPSTPNFVFSLGFKALNIAEESRYKVPASAYVDEYDLLEVAIVSDNDYLEYLKQVGVA